MNGWVTDWNDVGKRTQQLVTTDLARKLMQDNQQFVPTHRATQLNLDTLSEELKERAPHSQIKLILNPGVSDSDAFAVLGRILDQYMTVALGKERRTSETQTMPTRTGQDAGLVQERGWESKSSRSGDRPVL